MSNLYYNYSITMNDDTIEAGTMNWFDVDTAGEVITIRGNEGAGNYPVIKEYKFADFKKHECEFIEGSDAGHRNPYKPYP